MQRLFHMTRNTVIVSVVIVTIILSSYTNIFFRTSPETIKKTKGTVETTLLNDYSKIVLIGQFNFDTEADSVEHFVKRWNELFRAISVWGPFSSGNYTKLQERGIDVDLYIADNGFYSPYLNLAKSLLRYANDPTIDGVLLTHDDLMFNVSRLSELGFPSNGHILMQNFTSHGDASAPLLYFSNMSTIRAPDNETFIPVKKFRSLLRYQKRWYWWRKVVPTFANATSITTNDTRAKAFQNADGTFTLYTPSPGDFIYIPTKFAQQFYDMAMWLGDYHVFLEGGVSTIVGYLRDHYDANVTYVETCTDWNYTTRNTAQFVYNCIQEGKFLDVYHPIKLSLVGNEGWDHYFDRIVYDRSTEENERL